MTKKRDYRVEYDTYHSAPEQIKNRAKRNAARSTMEKKGLVQKGDGKEVDHKTPIRKGGGNSKGNLQVVSRAKNRAWRKGL
jgi:hypothetical protein